jgi:MFS family permease
MSSSLTIERAKGERWSSLGRDIDPRVPSNRLAVAGAFTAAVVAGLAGLFGPEIGLSPVSAAIGVFLSWAIARELDPDHPAAAAIALPVSLVLLIVLGPSSLLVSTGVLLGMRMTAGTVGAPLRPLDIVGIVALSALLGTNVIGVVGVAAMGLGVLVDMGLGVLVDEPNRKRAIAIVASSATVFAGALLISGVERVWTMPDAAGWGTLVIGAVATLLVIPAASPTSSTDRSTDVVRRGRVTAARVAAGIAVLVGFFLAGGAGIAALAGTATAALIGTGIRRIGSGRR